MLHRSISPLFPLLRRAAYLLTPVNTLNRPLSAPFAGGTTATLDFPKLAVFARMRDTTTGDVTGGCDTGHGGMGESLRLVMVVWDWHRSAHRGRHGDRHLDGHGSRGRVHLLAVVELVDLEGEKVADWGTYSLDWLRDRIITSLRNRDWDGGDR